MNASVGYFTADRADFDDGVFPDEIFSKREAWFWIRANVAYRPSSVIVGASTIELQPGQLAFSLRFLAARWGWASPMHVKRFLGWLAKRGRIAITSNRDRTMIEVTDEAEKPVNDYAYSVTHTETRVLRQMLQQTPAKSDTYGSSCDTLCDAVVTRDDTKKKQETGNIEVEGYSLRSYPRSPDEPAERGTGGEPIPDRAPDEIEPAPLPEALVAADAGRGASGLEAAGSRGGKPAPEREPKPRRHEWPENYWERFYQAYPKKQDKKAAQKSLDKIHKSDRVNFIDIMEGLDRMIVSGIELQFVPMPSTFLNRERWNDAWTARRTLSPNKNSRIDGTKLRPSTLAQEDKAYWAALAGRARQVQAGETTTNGGTGYDDGSSVGEWYDPADAGSSECAPGHAQPAGGRNGRLG